ncbi:hypothetical protein T4B_906 [Trichinella pseudospiralis]|uniref:Uncharacterized protein n=1 Tax=Trichinella pseudospiralis TaxID=6337 RepID=A0A0V1IW63_TRIPS|nr:hypothetical protein T4B_906 [Trichinella pseudospiralis]KRZ40278.1 hypothetical protein T4C_11410 [Trichinella pseudospiralis]
MILSRATTSAQIATTRGARAPSWPPWRVCARARQRQRFHRREERWRCVDVSRWNEQQQSIDRMENLTVKKRLTFYNSSREYESSVRKAKQSRQPEASGAVLCCAVLRRVQCSAQRCCPLCSGLITRERSSRRRRAVGAVERRTAPADYYCRPLTINRYALIGSPTGQSTATRRSRGQRRTQ